MLFCFVVFLHKSPLQLGALQEVLEKLQAKRLPLWEKKFGQVPTVGPPCPYCAMLMWPCAAPRSDSDQPTCRCSLSQCDVGEQCAVRKGARIGKMCDCPRGAFCNFYLLKCLWAPEALWVMVNVAAGGEPVTGATVPRPAFKIDGQKSSQPHCSDDTIQFIPYIWFVWTCIAAILKKKNKKGRRGWARNHVITWKALFFRRQFSHSFMILIENEMKPGNQRHWTRPSFQMSPTELELLLLLHGSKSGLATVQVSTSLRSSICSGSHHVSTQA